MGVREHRDAVPGLPPGRACPDGVREDRRRRDGQPLHRDCGLGLAPHPVGQGRRLRRPRGLRGGARPPDRRHQQQHLPGRGLQARVGLQPGPARPGQGRGRHRRVLRDRPGDERPGGQGLARRRHQLPGPGRPALAPSPPRGGPQGGLRGAAGRRPHVPGVQALRARPIRHRRAGLGPEPQRRPPARRPGRRLRGHGPPCDGRQHRADRRAAPGRGPPRRLRPQRQEVRRRRPDGRLDRSLPAVPDRPRARQRDARRRRRGRPGVRQRHDLHARPVPQHRAQGAGHDPERHEPPGDDREGAPGGPRAAARGAGGGRRARGQRLPVGCVQHRRPAHARGAARAHAASRRTRTALTSRRARSRRSTPPAPAARRPAGAEP